MQRTRNLFISTLSFALLLFLASTVRAQIDVGNYSISGGAEVGVLFGHQEGKDARFEEYRDLTHNIPLVPELQFMLGSKKEDFYLNFDSTKLGFDDQNYRLRFGRYGLLDLEFEWDQFPHLFSEDVAKTPFALDEGHTTTFSLSSKPSATTATTNCATSPICQWVNSNSHGVDLKLFNGIARFKVRYTPTPGWTFAGSYWSNDNSGKRAFGTLFGSPGTFNIVELTEPISYQTHNIELGGEYAGKGWSVGLKYNASLFHNSNSSIVWDNPLNLTGLGPSKAFGGGCTDAATLNLTTGTGPCQGRLDLYPSNQAHTVTLSGAAVLPLRTRFMGTASYGVRLQDDSFLPFTINTAICPNQSTCFPSRSSLGGDVRPLMVNATLVNNFVDRLNLKAYYRLYDLSNHNKTVIMPNGIVVNDQGGFDSVGSPVTPDRFYYSKNNVGFEGGYDITRWLSGKLGYSWERMHRSIDREVTNTDEHTVGPTFDIKPWSSLLFRASYRHSWRNSPNYEAAEDVDAANISRKFDEAKRDRDKSSLFAQYTLWDRLMLYTGFEFTSERYDAILGTQNDINYSPSVGLVYSPLDWLKLFADYNWDRYDWLLHAMDRVPVGGLNTQTPATDCVTLPNRCWTARGHDTVHTISLGSDMSLIPDLLGFRIQYGFSTGRSEVRSSGDTAGSVQATNYVPLENVWHELLMRFEYRILKNLALKFGYYFNHANEQDKGVDIMKLWMGDVDTVPTPNTSTARSIFLGDQIKGPFTAHMGFVTLAWKF